MKAYPATPSVSEAPADLFERGHLWLYEHVVGAPFRFQLTEHGAVRVGDAQRTYAADDVPLSHRHASRHVRDRLNREALRSAVETVEDIVFIGQATIQRGVPYEWDRLPSFLGVDIWHAGREQFLPPGTVENSYRRLGLDPLNTVAREMNARDFDPESAWPDSEWYDGPVAGILIENKRGERARRENPDVTRGDDRNPDESPVALAERLATDDRLSRVVSSLREQGRPVTVDAVRERLFDAIVREEYGRYVEGMDTEAFRSALGGVVGEYLAE